MLHIAGLGVSGSYLLKRLQSAGFNVSGYDPKRPGFYVPCGYAVNMNKLRELLGRIDMDAEAYLEAMAGEVTFASDSGINVKLPSTGFCTIDKNRLESDMLTDLKYQKNVAPFSVPEKDLIIDATGISRRYLGPAAGDVQMRTIEFLTDSAPHGDFYFRYFPSGRGYYWEFPLRDGFHIGAGGDSLDIVSNSLKDVRNSKRVMSRNIRLSPLFDQAHKGNIIGVGEAIGTVSPITGEGIVPSMESAEILFNCISRYDDPVLLGEKYVEEIKSKFNRYTRLFTLLNNARQGKLRRVGNLTALSSAKEDFENFGIQLDIMKVVKQIIFT